jgi:hypothetical protein
VRRPRKNEIITAQTNISNVNTMICVDGWTFSYLLLTMPNIHFPALFYY